MSILRVRQMQRNRSFESELEAVQLDQDDVIAKYYSIKY